MNATTRATLDAYAARMVRQGAQVEPLSDTSVVVVRRKPIRHVLHLALTLLTGGLWAVAWLVLVLRNKPRRTVATIGENGRVTER